MSKYKNKKTLCDGIKFDSIKERDYYIVLKQRERNGEISGLRLQSKFELIPKQDGERAVNYLADFDYFDNQLEQRIVADVKSKITKELSTYIIKRKLMLYVHGLRIVEI